MSKQRRYSAEQIVAKLREHEKLQAQGLTIPQACKRIGISDQDLLPLADPPMLGVILVTQADRYIADGSDAAIHFCGASWEPRSRTCASGGRDSYDGADRLAGLNVLFRAL